MRQHRTSPVPPRAQSRQPYTVSGRHSPPKTESES
jgi:hypothetical protein